MLFFTISGAPVSIKAPRQLLRAMKLMILFLITVYLQVSAAEYGLKVTISGKDMPLEKVLSMVKKQTGYVSFYGYEMLQGIKNVSLDLRDADVDEVMKACLWRQGLDFSTIKVNGVVFNNERQPISGANITIRFTGKGTITNAKGEFGLGGVPENSRLVINYIEYTAQEVKAVERKTVQEYSNVAKNELDKVVVQACGTTSQRLAIGNVAKVNVAEKEKQPVINPMIALQGELPQLNIYQVNVYIIGHIYNYISSLKLAHLPDGDTTESP